MKVSAWCITGSRRWRSTGDRAPRPPRLAKTILETPVPSAAVGLDIFDSRGSHKNVAAPAYAECGLQLTSAPMPFISITRLRVRAFRYLPAFLINALRSARQAKTAHGNLSVSVLRDSNFTFWTCTVWIDEKSMRSFMISGAHRRVMPRLLGWCDEASVAHWTQNSLEPPEWEEAHRRMQSEGRRSKVNNPSEAQQRFEIPPPRR
jgi:heme-degrading monooxygenase HmoA